MGWYTVILKGWTAGGCNNADKNHRPRIDSMKLDTKIYAEWFYLYEVQEQIKLINGDGSQRNDYLWMRKGWLLTGKG